MLLDKTLLLKGVAGVAAVGGVVGGGFALKSAFSRAPTKEEKLEEINKKLDSLGLGDCHFTEKEITNINEFSRECELNLEKLQKIKFSNKSEKNNVTVTGLAGESNIKLNIAENNGKVSYTFKKITSKLTISGDPAKPNITLKENVDREFEEREGKLGKVSKASQEEAAKTKEVNKKLSDLKIPGWCRFDESEKDENSIECDLSNKTEELKKIDFSNKEKGADSKIEGSTNGLKLTINRLSDDEGKLKHTFPKDLEFIFGGTYSNEIKIKDNRTTDGVSDIILKPNTNPTLAITDENTGGAEINRLSKAFNSYYLGWKMGLNCTTSSSYYSCKTRGTTTTIKLLNSKADGLEEIKVADGQDAAQIMTATEDVQDYEQGIKFTVTTAFPSDSPKLENNACYQAKYVTGKGWGLVKKTSC